MYAVCERARSLISLEVDGELSEVEAAQLHTHISLCSACSGHRVEIHTLTNQLRTAPLEAPTRRVQLPSRRAARVTRSQLGVAAALAVVVLGSASLFTADIEPDAVGSPRQAAPPSSPVGAGTVSIATLNMARGAPSRTFGADFVLL